MKGSPTKTRTRQPDIQDLSHVEASGPTPARTTSECSALHSGAPNPSCAAVRPPHRGPPGLVRVGSPVQKAKWSAMFRTKLQSQARPSQPETMACCQGPGQDSSAWEAGQQDGGSWCPSAVTCQTGPGPSTSDMTEEVLGAC